MYTSYAINSWYYDAFTNRKFDVSYQRYWEHTTPNALNKVRVICKDLIKRKKTFDKGLVTFEFVIKKEQYGTLENVAFPKEGEILYTTLL